MSCIKIAEEPFFNRRKLGNIQLALTVVLRSGLVPRQQSCVFFGCDADGEGLETDGPTP